MTCMILVADRGTMHTQQADDAVCLGKEAALYTSISALMQAAKTVGADAVHPGYGFLSESPDFAVAVSAAGMQWLGPRAETMRDFALKHVAKGMAVKAGVPILAGSPLVATSAGMLARLFLAR
jgi:urea carboxylase